MFFEIFISRGQSNSTSIIENSILKKGMTVVSSIIVLA